MRAGARSGGVTVSGISSGAFFAHQFHVAYSGLVKGAAMVAGGLYACAEQVDDVVPPHPFTGIPKSVAAALAVCTRFGRTGFALSFWRQTRCRPIARGGTRRAGRGQDRRSG